MKAYDPLTVEVLAYAPVEFFHCQHCEFVWHQSGLSGAYHQEQAASSLPDDLKEQYQQLSDWVREMAATYGDQIDFRVIDAASIEGCLKSVRYGVHRFPAVIVDRKERISGLDFPRVEESIRQKIARIK